MPYLYKPLSHYHAMRWTRWPLVIVDRIHFHLAFALIKSQEDRAAVRAYCANHRKLKLFDWRLFSQGKILNPLPTKEINYRRSLIENSIALSAELKRRGFSDENRKHWESLTWATVDDEERGALKVPTYQR